MNANLTRKMLTAATVAAFLVPLAMSNIASAHTTAIGWSKGAAAGSVNLFMGTYHRDGVGDGPDLEGAAHLTGPGGYDSTALFTTAYTTGARPSLLPLANIQLYSNYKMANCCGLICPDTSIGGKSTT